MCGTDPFPLLGGVAPETHFYGLDGHNNVRTLLDKAGTVTDTYSYDAFGVPLQETFNDGGATPNDYSFSAQQFDQDLGLYYIRARYSQTGLGRFWSSDSFEGSSSEPPSLHKYAYCGNDPVNQADLSGHDLEGSGLGGATFAKLGFSAVFAAAGTEAEALGTGKQAPQVKTTRVILVVDKASMPSSFKMAEIRDKLQSQMTEKVFDAKSSGRVQIRIVTGNMNLPPGWSSGSKEEFVNVIHWGPAPAGGMASSNLKGETWIDIISVNTYFSDANYSVNSQFFANLLAHEVFWHNTGKHVDPGVGGPKGGEISSGQPTYRKDDFDVLPASRRTILKDFGFTSK